MVERSILAWPSEWSEYQGTSDVAIRASDFLDLHNVQPNSSPAECIAAQCKDSVRAKMLLAGLSKEGNNLAADYESLDLRLLSHLFSMIALVGEKVALWCEDAKVALHHPLRPEEFRDSVKIHGVLGTRTTVTRHEAERSSVHRLIDSLTAFYELSPTEINIRRPKDRWMFDEAGLQEHYRQAFSGLEEEKVISHVRGRLWDAARANDVAMDMAPSTLTMNKKAASLTSIAMDNGPKLPGLISPNSQHLYFPQDLSRDIKLSDAQIRQTAKTVLHYKRGGKIHVNPH